MIAWPFDPSVDAGLVALIGAKAMACWPEPPS
jgi:hypothetical protein